jgi:hypothetical protein
MSVYEPKARLSVVADKESCAVSPSSWCSTQGLLIYGVAMFLLIAGPGVGIGVGVVVWYFLPITTTTSCTTPPDLFTLQRYEVEVPTAAPFEVSYDAPYGELYVAPYKMNTPYEEGGKGQQSATAMIYSEQYLWRHMLDVQHQLVMHGNQPFLPL